MTLPPALLPSPGRGETGVLFSVFANREEFRQSGSLSKFGQGAGREGASLPLPDLGEGPGVRALKAGLTSRF